MPHRVGAGRSSYRRLTGSRSRGSQNLRQVWGLTGAVIATAQVTGSCRIQTSVPTASRRLSCTPFRHRCALGPRPRSACAAIRDSSFYDRLFRVLRAPGGCTTRLDRAGCRPRSAARVRVAAGRRRARWRCRFLAIGFPVEAARYHRRRPPGRARWTSPTSLPMPGSAMTSSWDAAGNATLAWAVSAHGIDAARYSVATDRWFAPREIAPANIRRSRTWLSTRPEM